MSYAGLSVVQPGQEVKSLGMVYGPAVLAPQHQWERIAAEMRKRVAQWAKRKGLTVWGRVAIANTLISSTTTYLAAFTQPSDEQLAKMDRLIWAAVWGKDVGAAQGLRGGWLSVEAAQLPPQEGGLGLILPSNMIRSRQ